jgi:hypothetical protein
MLLTHRKALKISTIIYIITLKYYDHIHTERLLSSGMVLCSGGRKFLQNVCKFLPDYFVSYLRRL